MVEAKFLRSMAERLRQLKVKLEPSAAPKIHQAVSELDAMARDFERWADATEGKPKENGQDQFSS